MVVVRIPFKERFRESMLNDIKTWTSRTRRYGKPRDHLFAFGHEFVIKKVERRTLDDVADHYREEGCESRDDFIAVWNDIHRRKGFNPWQRVFVHIFRRISI